MSSGLATRCTQCSTVFRVVPDQLRVSDGFVRCGRCGEVFNAGASLLDLDTGKPVAAGLPVPALEQATTALPEAVPPSTAAVGDDQVDRFGGAGGAGDAGSGGGAGAAVPRDVREFTGADAGVDGGFGHEPVAVPAEFASAAHAEAVPPHPDIFADRFGADAPAAPAAPAAPDSPAVADVAPELPSFVRRAERSQRWRRPRVRAALAAAAAVAALLLAAQAALAWRDVLAAQVPAARAPLAAACSVLGCTVGPLRVIDSLSVESSGLVRVEQSSLYRLNVALRNRAASDVALPALELAVSDAGGKLLARRVLRPADMGSTQTQLAPGRDLALQATLQVPPGVAVSGYTVELFYP